MNLSEQIGRIKVLMEQERWVTNAANNKQRCGLSGNDNSSVSGGGRMSRRAEKKSNEQYFKSLLTSSTSPDYKQRQTSLLQSIDLETIDGKIDANQKFSLIYNLTNKLNSNKAWFLNSFIKKDLNIKDETDLTDKNILDFIKMKGGFDGFKDYYLNTLY